MEPFAAEMRERGWVEGLNFTGERRFTGADPSMAPALARELVALRVDVTVTAITGSAIATRRASSQIPIVMVSSGYPVEAGLAHSLGIPGGNVTGNATYVGGKVFGKYLELGRVLPPHLTRLGVLWDYLPPVATVQEAGLALEELKRAALTLAWRPAFERGPARAICVWGEAGRSAPSGARRPPEGVRRPLRVTDTASAS